MNFFTIFITALLANNIVLSGFLGICSYLGVSKKTSSAVGMGIALTAVTFLAAIVSWGLDKLLIALNIEYMQTVCFILVIATLVQISEMIIKKFIPSLYKSLGIYLPLITTNCIVLYVARQVTTFDFANSIAFALGTSLGYLVIIIVFSAIREKLDNAPIAKGFKGIAIALITTAIMAMAFSGFVGLF